MKIIRWFLSHLLVFAVLVAGIYGFLKYAPYWQENTNKPAFTEVNKPSQVSVAPIKEQSKTTVEATQSKADNLIQIEQKNVKPDIKNSETQTPEVKNITEVEERIEKSVTENVASIEKNLETIAKNINESETDSPKDPQASKNTEAKVNTPVSIKKNTEDEKLDDIKASSQPEISESVKLDESSSEEKTDTLDTHSLDAKQDKKTENVAKNVGEKTKESTIEKIELVEQKAQNPEISESALKNVDTVTENSVIIAPQKGKVSILPITEERTEGESLRGEIKPELGEENNSDTKVVVYNDLIIPPPVTPEILKLSLDPKISRTIQNQTETGDVKSTQTDVADKTVKAEEAPKSEVKVNDKQKVAGINQFIIKDIETPHKELLIGDSVTGAKSMQVSASNQESAIEAEEQPLLETSIETTQTTTSPENRTSAKNKSVDETDSKVIDTEQNESEEISKAQATADNNTSVEPIVSENAEAKEIISDKDSTLVAKVELVEDSESVPPVQKELLKGSAEASEKSVASDDSIVESGISTDNKTEIIEVDKLESDKVKNNVLSTKEQPLAIKNIKDEPQIDNSQNDTLESVFKARQAELTEQLVAMLPTNNTKTGFPTVPSHEQYNLKMKKRIARDRQEMLWRAARRAFSSQNYTIAEKKYLELIEQAPNKIEFYGELSNVYKVQKKKAEYFDMLIKITGLLIKKKNISQSRQMIEKISSYSKESARKLEDELTAMILAK